MSGLGEGGETSYRPVLLFTEREHRPLSCRVGRTPVCPDSTRNHPSRNEAIEVNCGATPESGDDGRGECVGTGRIRD